MDKSEQPEQPAHLTTYVRRDTGNTAQGDYRHWTTVLSNDESAAIWNHMSYLFRLTGDLTPNRLEWLKCFFRLRIEKKAHPADRDILKQKLQQHIEQAERTLT